jgi:hypothetical protein
VGGPLIPPIVFSPLIPIPPPRSAASRRFPLLWLSDWLSNGSAAIQLPEEMSRGKPHHIRARRSVFLA